MTQAAETDSQQSLRQTPLHDLHVALGAKMVPFAGYWMPLQYQGILAEHGHVRTAAGLFDVSHMGQITLTGVGADEALERLLPGDIQGLAPGRLRYSLLTNDAGGILDDLMVTRRADDLLLVVNAACKHQDLAHLQRHLSPSGVTVTAHFARALLALQGPQAAAALAALAPEVAALGFMQAGAFSLAGRLAWISRSGYTGEDGFEIGLDPADAAAVTQALLAQPAVKPIGLGARDSLRLEAGLCLYGHDIDQTTTPVEAALEFALSKRRRAQGGFMGADAILPQLETPPPRRRVGLALEGRQPAREGAEIIDDSGGIIGRVTSGGFAPSLGRPIAIGYVATRLAQTGQALGVLVRGKTLVAEVTALPFVPNRYFRKLSSN